jgi:hypothetical protein
MERRAHLGEVPNLQDRPGRQLQQPEPPPELPARPAPPPHPRGRALPRHASPLQGRLTEAGQRQDGALASEDLPTPLLQ